MSRRLICHLSLAETRCVAAPQAAPSRASSSGSAAALSSMLSGQRPHSVSSLVPSYCLTVFTLQGNLCSTFRISPESSPFSSPLSPGLPQQLQNCFYPHLVWSNATSSRNESVKTNQMPPSTPVTLHLTQPSAGPTPVFPDLTPSLAII